MVKRSKLAVILHADVAGSTRLVQLDEEAAHERIQDAFRRLATAVSEAGGTTQEIRGDALVAELGRASDALSVAVVFQSQNQEHNESLTGEVRPELRIGIALGEVIVADGTVTGAGVILAQRLEQLALPGEVVVQGAIHDVIPRRLPIQFDDLGAQELKGFEEPVRAFRAVSGATSELLQFLEGQPNTREVATTNSREVVLYGASGPPVAVLPFRNLSSDAEQVYFADGVSEDIIQALSASHSFPVFARSSTFAYREMDVQSAGEELGAKYVVSGSVRRAGNRIRVSVELADTQTRVQLWSDRFDRTLDDLFEVQDEITTTVAGIVQPEIDLQEMRRASAAPPATMGAYERTQKGFWHLSQDSEEHYVASARQFQEALHLDAAYARAYSGFAQGKYIAASQLWEERTRTFHEAIRSARMGLKLDDKNPVALRYMGGAFAQLGQLDEAMLPLRKSITVWPSYATAYSGLAWALALNGDFEDAVTAEATTARLRPRDPRMYVCMMSKAVAKYALGDYEDAETVSRQSLNISDGFWLSSLMLVASLGRQGRASDSAPAREKLALLLPGLKQKGLAEIMPFKSGEHLDDVAEGLQRAGMQLS